VGLRDITGCVDGWYKGVGDMRKSLLMGGAALVAFALVFGACDGSGYDVTMTDTAIPSLAGPGNLKAVNEQEGVITVTWDPVYDAAGYEVWRKTGDDPAVKITNSSNKLFPSGSGNNRFDDVISASNVLKVATAYTYTVVAVSSKSTRSVEVVQSGTSSVTIPADQVAKIPATYTVPNVGNLKVAPVTLPNGSKVVQLSWDKNPNPGVEYRGELAGGQTFSHNAVDLSLDGTKVVYNYYYQNQPVSLVDGEKYKVKVTASYKDDYYTASAAEEVVYTHSDLSIISDFSVSVVTKRDSSNDPTGAYEISLSWKEKTTPVSYKLYVHKNDGSGSSSYEWTEVTIETPTTGAIGLRTLRLSSNLPAYRQSWYYKLVALGANDEEIDTSTRSLNDAPWSSSLLNVGTLTFDTTVAKTLKFEVAQFGKDRLVTGETVEFYAVPSSITNVESDYILNNATLIKSFTKGSLESVTASNRTAEKEFSNGGSYGIVAFVKNGNELTEVAYWVGYNNYGPNNGYYAAYVPNN
jgi:hypothetical protein